MRNIAKGLIVAMSILATSATATEFGKVRLPGEATIKHEGDYVVYNLRFEAKCHTEEQVAITEVSNDVLSFVSWLDNRTLDFNNGSIEYWAALISTVRDDNPYIYDYDADENERIENPCYLKFSTSQAITVRVTRADSIPSITKTLVQSFYDEIYQFLWPFNHRAATESNAWTSAKITYVNKGVHDETLENMKELAYAKAANVATARFLAVLGKLYSGQWFFYGADFTNERYVSSRHLELDAPVAAPVSGGVPIPVPPPVATPTVINLEPLQYSVDGVFEFGFTRDFNDLAH